MSNNAPRTVTIRGELSYAQVLGEPRFNYNKDGKEWKFDVKISKDTVKEMKAFGIGDRVKTKDGYLDGAPYMSFKQAELRKDGKPNRPIPVVDITNKAWDSSKLLGNGTIADVKFVIQDFGPGKRTGVYPRGIRVLKLESFVRNDFDPIDEDDEFYSEILNSTANEDPFEDDELPI